MSDSEDYDDYDDLGYFFIEEAYAPADDLAEHTCPSPMPYEGDDDWDDHSRFTSYWNDLKYNSDSYYDKPKKLRNGEKPSSTSATGTQRTGAPVSKKRRVQYTSRSTTPFLLKDDLPPVLWVSQKDRSRPRSAKAAIRGASASIFSDWRERFAATSGFPSRIRPTKLVEVPDIGYEGEGEDDVPQPANSYSLHKPTESPRHRPEPAQSTEDNDPGGPALDPDALKAALRQNLSAAGIPANAIDESTLLRFATRMFSQSDAAEDILGELVAELFGPEDDEEDEDGEEAEPGGFAGWIAARIDSKAQQPQQQLPQPTPKQRENGTGASAAADGVALAGSPAKRKLDASAAEALAADMPAPKRAAKSFEAPTQASRARKAVAVPRGAAAKGKGRA